MKSCQKALGPAVCYRKPLLKRPFGPASGFLSARPRRMRKLSFSTEIETGTKCKTSNLLRFGKIAQ